VRWLAAILGLIVQTASFAEWEYQDDAIMGTSQLFAFCSGSSCGGNPTGIWEYAASFEDLGGGNTNFFGVLVSASDATQGGNGISAHVDYDGPSGGNTGLKDHGPLVDGNVLRFSAWLTLDPAAPSDQNWAFALLKFEFYDVKLGNPDAGTLAFVHYDQRRAGLPTLDHYLDAVLAGINEGGLEAEQTGRSDVTVGKAEARRMDLTWKDGEQPFGGFFSLWLDGETIFMFIGAVPGHWTSSAEQHFATLQNALQFSAPIETCM